MSYNPKDEKWKKGQHSVRADFVIPSNAIDRNIDEVDSKLKSIFRGLSMVSTGTFAHEKMMNELDVLAGKLSESMRMGPTPKQVKRIESLARSIESVMVLYGG